MQWVWAIVWSAVLVVIGGFAMNLPGPDFLGLYACLYLGASIIALVLGRHADPPLPPAAERPETTNPFILAYLRGGQRAVVVTALTGLYRRGQVTFSKEKVVLPAPGQAHRIQEHAPPDEADRQADAESVWLEAHLLSLLGTSGNPLTIAELTAASEQELAPIEATAKRHGLVRGPGAMRRAALLSLLPLVLVFLIGLAKIGVGSARHKPITFLVLGLVIVVITAVVLLAKLPTLSRLGRWLLDATRNQCNALSLTADRAISQLSIAEVRLAAGLFGVAIFGQGLEAIAYADHVVATSGTTTWPSYGSSGGSSSCGGGCGGGCGGCS